MLENVLGDLVSQYSRSAISGNASISEDKQNDIVQVLSESLLGGMKNQVSQGNVAGLLDIFSSKTTTSIGNPILNGIQSSAASMLSQRIGLNPMIANGIVSTIVPMVMSSLGKKANDPQDNSLDFNDLIKSIGGGSAMGGIDLNSIMNRLDDDNDGFGIDDVVRAVSGTQKGGIFGMLGGLFGK